MIGAENGDYEERRGWLFESLLNSGRLFSFMSKKAYIKQGIGFDLKINHLILCLAILRTTEGWLMPR